MNNINFIRRIALAGLALLLHAQVFGQQTGRSNIIFILTDDQRAGALGYAGNDIIHTPEMDRLARQGVYFKKAMVTTPICAASRASLLTGLYERTHGYTFAQGPLKQPYMEMSYPVILRDNGYYTGFFGKLGVSYKNATTLFDQAESYDRNTKYPDRRAYFYQTIAGDTVHLTRYTGHQAQAFIRNAPRDKPFCLSLSFSAPHAADSAPDQYFWQEKSDSLYTGITIPPAALGDKMDFMALPKEVREGFNRRRWHWRFDTPEKYQKSIKGYYRMISEIDDEIGELRQVLKEEGLAKNTIIIFMGDNGYYLGERQLAGKWLMHDLSVRVPLIIYDPRVGPHDDVEDIVLNIDVPKTILAMAGIQPLENYQGLDLTPYLTTGEHPGKRKAALIEHLWELPDIPSSEGIRTDRWKYFRYRFIDAPEELYDLENDPSEAHNLAGQPEYRKVLKRLRKATDRQINQYENARLVPYEPRQYGGDKQKND